MQYSNNIEKCFIDTIMNFRFLYGHSNLVMKYLNIKFVFKQLLSYAVIMNKLYQIILYSVSEISRVQTKAATENSKY